MPSPILRIAALALCLLLSGCSRHSLVDPASEGLKLLPPAELASEVLLKQVVTLQAGARERQFLVVARFETRRLRLVVLTPAGQALMSLDYDGVDLVQETRSPEPVPGRDILAIVQFATWPAQSIVRNYPKSDGWIVEIDAQNRSLLTAAGALLKITHLERGLIVDNFLQNYRVIVKTLEKEAL